MKLYDFTTLTTAVPAQATTLAALEQSLPKAGGRLLGCWTADVGSLNRIMILRSFESADAILSARDEMLRSDEPLGIATGLETIDTGTYALFPFLPDIEPAAYGRCYELRTYHMKSGKLTPTIAAWEASVPARSKISPLVGAMYALDGSTPRFLNIWGYPSADARAQARSDAVAQKIWPPVGGPANLTPQMTSTLAVPTAFSPLR